MAWYRSIGIDTADVVEPRFVSEYSYYVQDRLEVTQTFTVVNPGLYFLSSNGSGLNIASPIFSFDVTSNNSPIYTGYLGSSYGKFCFINLDAGDTVVFKSGESSRTDYAKRQTFSAIRILNASFVSVGYSNTNPGQYVRYSPPLDSNMHLIFATANTVYYGASGNCSDDSIIPGQCDNSKIGDAENGLVTRIVGSYNDDVYINLRGYYGEKNDIFDFILQPMSKITGTLTAGQSTITLYDQRIRSGSNVSVLTSNGAWYRDIDVTDGSCTIEFPIQDTDISVEIEVS